MRCRNLTILLPDLALVDIKNNLARFRRRCSELCLDCACRCRKSCWLVVWDESRPSRPIFTMKLIGMYAFFPSSFPCYYTKHLSRYQIPAHSFCISTEYSSASLHLAVQLLRNPYTIFLPSHDTRFLNPYSFSHPLHPHPPIYDVKISTIYLYIYI